MDKQWYKGFHKTVLVDLVSSFTTLGLYSLTPLGLYSLTPFLYDSLFYTPLLVFKKDIGTDENALIIFYVKQKQNPI